MKPGHAFYEWKVRHEDGELYTPHSDPMFYEYPFDYQFDSVEEAYQGLEDWGIVEMYFDDMEDESGEFIEKPEKWHPEHWVLVKTVSEVVE